MKVDPPGPSESDEDLLGQARDAANGTTSGPRGQAALTARPLSTQPARVGRNVSQLQTSAAGINFVHVRIILITSRV